MKKILICLALFLAAMFTVSTEASEINKSLNALKLDKTSIVSVSVRNIETGKTIWSKNDEKFMHPASSLKLLTFAASLGTLGEDYTFDTTIYADSSNNLYIKLGADPLLKVEDLTTLVGELKKNFNVAKIKNIYIDDTIIDKEPYPDGWMWDDFWPNIPKLSPYTLNQNFVTIALRTKRDDKTTTVSQTNPYRIAYINHVVQGIENNIKIKKDYDSESDIISLRGTITQDTTLLIPVTNPKYYFIANLSDVFQKEKITYKKRFCFEKTPNNVREIAKVSHSIKQVGSEILKNSNNFASEITFKVASTKCSELQKPGNTDDGINMFYNYYKQLGLDTENIRIADSSGVSRYNLLTTSWISEALVLLDKETKIKAYMAQPDEGTLKRRLIHLKGKLWAKTGTLNGISSLAGYITDARTRPLAFAIIISNFNKKPSIVKGVEDDLMDDIFKL